MATLEEFLLERIAEDEAVIEATREGWHVKPRSTLSSNVAALTVGMHPSRARAECEAKRRIVEWHQNWPVLVEGQPEFEPLKPGAGINEMTLTMSRQIAWMTEREYVARFGTEPPTSPILRLLALPYADHPDYNEAWRA